jgi:hypothetical protein
MRPKSGVTSQFVLAMGALLALLGSAQHSYAAMPSLYQQALLELDQAKIDSAYAHLEQLTASDAEFVDALVEEQKIHYLRGEWQKFFGYARFYRENLLFKNSVPVAPAFRARLFSLEILALAKHCRWKEALAVGELGQAIAQSIGLPPSAELGRALTFLHLDTQYPNALEGKEQGRSPWYVRDGKIYWPLQANQLQYVTHPRAVRVVVQSRCRAGRDPSSVLSSASGPATQDAIARATLLLNAGDHAQAYALLEQAFGDEPSADLRSQQAWLLALAEPKLLTTPRHRYAVYALENGRDIPVAERLRLMRIAGDGFFDEAKLGQARALYSQIIEHAAASIDDREYAGYKLGWIELNERNPAAASRRWLTLWKLRPDGALAEALLHDAGKSWAEAILLNRAAPLALPTGLSSLAAKIFIDGVLAGARRQSDPDFDRIEALFRPFSELHAQALAQFANAGVFESKPCSIIPWAADFKLPQAAVYRQTLQACAQQKLGHHDPSTLLKLASIYSLWSLQGKERLAKARVLSRVRQAAACGEFTSAHREVSSPESDAWMGESFTVCAKFSEKEELLSLTTQNFPYVEQLVHEAISSGQADAAKRILENHVPLQKAGSIDKIRLWTLLALSCPTAAIPSTQVADTLATVLKASQQPLVSDRRALVVLREKNSDWVGLSRDWTLVSDLLAQDVALAQPLLHQATGTGLPLSSMASDSMARYLRSMTQLRDESLPLPSNFSLKAPRSVAASAVQKDLSLLATERALETELHGLRLPIGTKLEASLALRMRELRRALDRANHHGWSEPTLLAASEHSLARATVSLASAIEAIRVHEEPRSLLLKQLADSIRRWKPSRDPASDRKVIQVGDLEVSGQVRKPMLETIDSKAHLKSVLPGIAQKSLARFEKEMTQFTQPEAGK